MTTPTPPIDPHVKQRRLAALVSGLCVAGVLIAAAVALWAFFPAVKGFPGVPGRAPKHDAQPEPQRERAPRRRESRRGHQARGARNRRLSSPAARRPGTKGPGVSGRQAPRTRRETPKTRRSPRRPSRPAPGSSPTSPSSPRPPPRPRRPIEVYAEPLPIVTLCTDLVGVNCDPDAAPLLPAGGTP